MLARTSAMNTPSVPSVVCVPWRGDVLDTIQMEDGKINVLPSRICDSLGLAWHPQLHKLQSAPWSGVTIMVTPDRQGRPQQHVTIPLKAVPMWLAGISVNKVKTGLRAKPLSFQLGMAEVLSARLLRVSDVPSQARDKNHFGIRRQSRSVGRSEVRSAHPAPDVAYGNRPPTSGAKEGRCSPVSAMSALSFQQRQAACQGGTEPPTWPECQGGRGGKGGFSTASSSLFLLPYGSKVEKCSLPSPDSPKTNIRKGLRQSWRLPSGPLRLPAASLGRRRRATGWNTTDAALRSRRRASSRAGRGMVVMPTPRPRSPASQSVPVVELRRVDSIGASSCPGHVGVGDLRAGVRR